MSEPRPDVPTGGHAASGSGGAGDGAPAPASAGGAGPSGPSGTGAGRRRSGSAHRSSGQGSGERGRGSRGAGTGSGGKGSGGSGSGGSGSGGSGSGGSGSGGSGGGGSRRNQGRGSRSRSPGANNRGGRPGQAGRNRSGGGRSTEGRGRPDDDRRELAAAEAASVAAATALRQSAADEAAAVAANRRRALVLCTMAGVLPALVAGMVLGVLLGALIGLVAAVVVLGAVALFVWTQASVRALRLLGVPREPTAGHARAANVLEGLCATFGLRVPELRVIEDPVPNACAVGRSPGEAVLVVTSGLLATLGPLQLEGVLAHELAHVRRHDTVVGAVAVSVLAPWARLTGDDTLLHRAVGAEREFRADQVAVAAVRYPPGLHSALSTVVAAPTPGPGSAFAPRRLAATRWIWLDPMVGRRDADPTGALDATSVRIAALGEL